MTRRRSSQHYQDQLDWLLTAQAFIAALAGSAVFTPDVPGWAVWVLGSAQAALAVAIFRTKKRLPRNETIDVPPPKEIP